MKRRTDMPSEQIMRFFTPELYIQFNSSDDEIANLANEAWEQALQDYSRHLENIRRRLPSQVRKIADLNLHDFDVVGFDQELQSAFPVPEPFWPGPFWSAMAMLSVKQERNLRCLIYMLWDGIREYPARKDWPFATERRHWLYDELDIDDDRRGLFFHRIMFSDGAIAEIPFATAITTNLTLPATDERAAKRQSA
jgi:hypothetical protein